jgi:hypothetical protein
MLLLRELAQMDHSFGRMGRVDGHGQIDESEQEILNLPSFNQLTPFCPIQAVHDLEPKLRRDMAAAFDDPDKCAPGQFR